MSEKSIVIVDDSIVNLQVALNALKDDYFVSTVSSGEGLIKLLDNLSPDLILLDIDMPGMNGFEVFDYLKANPKTEAIPVIFLTANESFEYEERSFAMGAADYMHKPFYPPFLRKRLALHLKEKALADLQMRLLKTVIELVQRRDEVSGGHVERTRKYVEVLLDVLVKNNIYTEITALWEKDLILHSTMLYDLGKLSINDAILQKPGKLEENEFAVIKNHTLMGVKIIDEIRSELNENSKEANILDYAKEFAGFHHEKWDGTGYPKGLKGYNIPLPGRIMAIADVYDALISKRTYNKSYTHEEAAKIIIQVKGTHFDPVLVDVFLSVSDEFKNIAGQQVIRI